jgi:hypothetical protein
MRNALLIVLACAGMILFVGCGSDLPTAPMANDDALSAPFTLDTMASTTEAAAADTTTVKKSPDDDDTRPKPNQEPTTWGHLKLMFPPDGDDSGDSQNQENQ